MWGGRRGPDFLFYLSGDVLVLAQVVLGILTPLAQAGLAKREEGATLLD